MAKHKSLKHTVLLIKQLKLTKAYATDCLHGHKTTIK